jgi:8-hydroxy-5-deazaflavin:NADPH oxidoreductase
MKIAIIGLGNVGSALARGWTGRHELLLGTRDASDAEANDLAKQTGGKLMSQADAAGAAEIVVLALPWNAAEKAVASLGNLAGKVVIDCMNPLGMVDGKLGLLVGHSTSGGEVLAGWLPGVTIVKTLNQVGAEIMADNARMAARPAMFMAGDDPQAKAKVTQLLADLGFEAMDAGDLKMARILEPYGMVWINQALLRGKGRDWAFAALPRN